MKKIEWDKIITSNNLSSSCLLIDDVIVINHKAPIVWGNIVYTF